MYFVHETIAHISYYENKYVNHNENKMATYI